MARRCEQEVRHMVSCRAIVLQRRDLVSDGLHASWSALLFSIQRTPACRQRFGAGILGLLACWILAACSGAYAEPWPYVPFDQPHGVGNHYGEFQNYGGSPYYHDGIDLVTPGGPTQTHSVSAGTLTHITYYEPLYSGLMIGAPVPNGEGWLYWHISAATMQFDVGDQVAVNDYIGTTAYWPNAAFHHVHFNRVQGTGGYPWSWYTAIDNPLQYMEPHTDLVAPVFETAYQGRVFAFAAQGTGSVLNPDALGGSVDIIAKISDVVGMPQWKVNPWRIQAWLQGATQSIPVTTTVLFSGQIPADNTIGVIYRTQPPMPSQGDYDYRNFYFIVTNTDGDGLVESSDANFSWNTAAFDPGDYWVYVRASDLGGSTTTDSMRCTVAGAINVDIVLPETSHDFGSIPVGSTATWAMIVENVGPDYLSVRSVVAVPPVFSVDRTHFYVPPAAEETLTVSFAPAQFGLVEGLVTLTTNDPDEPTVEANVAGYGSDVSIDLTGHLIGGQLVLTWSPLTEAAAYWVYGAEDVPWFVAGPAPGYQYRIAILPSSVTTWSTAAGIGDADANWTYLVLAVDHTEMEVGHSNRAGEIDFTGEIP